MARRRNAGWKRIREWSEAWLESLGIKTRRQKKAFWNGCLASLAIILLVLWFYRDKGVEKIPVKPVPVKPRPVKVLPATPKAAETSPIFQEPGVTGIAKPKILFVIDDIGQHRRFESDLRALGNKVTYAVLPQLPASRYFSRLSRQTGAEVILHQPMEPEGKQNPGPGVILRSMNEKEIRETLNRNLRDVPEAVGVNNHMGSAGTKDVHLMKLFLPELRNQELVFLDSKTSDDSIALQEALLLNLPVLKRDIFLDNSERKEKILAQIAETEKIARKNGMAVAIGHYKAPTLEVLKEEIPRLEKEGFELVTIGDYLNSRKRT